MTNTKGIVSCFAILGVLILLDIGLRVRNWHYNADVRNFAARFTVVTVHTNDSAGRLIVDRESGKPIWGEWNFGPAGQPDSVSYFYEGRNVMNVYPCKTGSPQFDITFFGPTGAVQGVWLQRGTNAGFTERTQYGSGKPGREIWFDERWYSLEHRTNGNKIQGGIVFDGKWRHVVFTNGAAVIEP